MNNNEREKASQTLGLITQIPRVAANPPAHCRSESLQIAAVREKNEENVAIKILRENTTFLLDSHDQ